MLQYSSPLAISSINLLIWSSLYCSVSDILLFILNFPLLSLKSIIEPFEAYSITKYILPASSKFIISYSLIIFSLEICFSIDISFKASCRRVFTTKLPSLSLPNPFFFLSRIFLFIILIAYIIIFLQIFYYPSLLILL